MKKLYLITLLLPLLALGQVQIGSDIDGLSGELFGASVAIDADGDRVVIGGHGSDIGGNNKGVVRAYEYSNGSWTQLGSDMSGIAAEDQAGYFNGVSINGAGTIVAFGNHGNDTNGNAAGAVSVYQYDTNLEEWQLLGNHIYGDGAVDTFGLNIELNYAGDRVVIGAPGHWNGSAGVSYAAVYEYSNGSWSQLGSNINDASTSGQHEQAGYGVAIDDDGGRVAIGAHRFDGTAGVYSGHVRVFEYINGSWTQMGSDIEGEATHEYLGQGVALNGDGDRVTVGAYGNDDAGNDAGVVRIYRYYGNSWTQLGADIPGSAAGDQLGVRLDMNQAGDKVILGSYTNNGLTGEARLFEYSYSAGSWSQSGNDIHGVAGQDYFGSGVGIASDGDRVVIGGHLHNINSGSGDDNYAGHAQMWSTNTLTAATLTTSGSTTSGSLTVDSVIIDGSNIGHTSDTDLMTLSSGSLTVAGDVTVSSDQRLKSNIVSLGPTLLSLLQLDGKKYTINSDSSQNQKIGLLAQEVQKVFPELVIEDKNGLLAVNYQALIPVLVNAIKEQEEGYKELENILNELENEIDNK